MCKKNFINTCKHLILPYFKHFQIHHGELFFFFLDFFVFLLFLWVCLFVCWVWFGLVGFFLVAAEESFICSGKNSTVFFTHSWSIRKFTEKLITWKSVGAEEMKYGLNE